MITSTSNQRVKELLQLQKKSKARNQAGVFLAEGTRMVMEAPQKRVRKVYVSESYMKKHEKELEEKGFVPEILSDTVFDYVSDTKTPQGILAVIRQMDYTLEEILKQKSPHILVLDNLQDPGNAGTIFRTAEAAGVTGILMSRDCVDIYNPKTIRSTMGAIYRMPFLYLDDVMAGIETVKEHGVRVYAAHLDGKNAYDQEDYQKGTAFLIGNEGNGLRKEVAECADAWVRIPMSGQVESLNAAVAATVLMFEVSRQRRVQ
ncbi:RNA methyltransferase [Faecalicatena orotica]|uniref:TrmH family RNA methyltransferase n=1 Tax=Faecalicatena orotica TaxID=1544 RepID=A0A2Y9BI69_9FIRM|nr:23S rRNA (guanosine(2251)-2'-O)-methyltransferase RlmB [Faecalicatena orotica]PWJ27645.1 TrmH family RNA methyltransferase [Faecalicatena orotica]SSA57175.1 RNA methyltransferase, TrmH family [Faecalicatena orotica]